MSYLHFLLQVVSGTWLEEVEMTILFSSGTTRDDDNLMFPVDTQVVVSNSFHETKLT